MSQRSKFIYGIFVYLVALTFLLFEMAIQVTPSLLTDTLMKELEVGAGAIGLISAFYFYSYMLMQVPVGLLFDRYNAQIILPISIFLCSLGVYIFGTSANIALIGLARFIMGAGSAFAFVGVLVVVKRWFHPRQFAFFAGIAQLAAAFGALSGVLFLSKVLDSMNWHKMMHLISIIGFVLTIISALIVRDNPDSNRHIPLLHDIRQELKVVLKSAQTWFLALFGFCSWAPVGVLGALWGVPFIELRYNVSTVEAAFAISFLWVGLGITSPTIGLLSDKIHKRKPFIIFCPLIGVIASIALIYFNFLTYWASVVLLLLIGVASAGQILSFAMVKEKNQPLIRSTAVSINNMTLVGGIALLQPLVGVLLHLFWDRAVDSQGIPIYSITDYEVSLSVIPACFFIAFIVALFFTKETYCNKSIDL